MSSENAENAWKISRRDLALWGAIVALTLALIAAVAILAGEIADLKRTVALLAGVETETGEAWPVQPPTVAAPVQHQVGAVGAVVSDTLAVTVTVRSSGAGDLLYEPPVVVDDGGRVYAVGGDSLEAARYAFLDLVTRGQAMARLEFAPAPPPGVRLVLVFNPSQQTSNVLAPRVEALIPLIAPTPTPMPTPTPDG